MAHLALVYYFLKVISTSATRGASSPHAISCQYKRHRILFWPKESLKALIENEISKANEYQKTPAIQSTRSFTITVKTAQDIYIHRGIIAWWNNKVLALLFHFIITN